MQKNRQVKCRKQVRHTLCDEFCDTYIIDGKVHSFILLPKLLVDRRLAENIRSMLMPSADPEHLCDYDGTPAYRIRHKFHRAIRRRGNSPTGLYGALNTFFSDGAIKELFPDAWLLNNNERARKRNAFEESERNHARKVDPKGFALHGQCAMRTRNLSVDRSVREGRGLAV